jgi:hypothetical protein
VLNPFYRQLHNAQLGSRTYDLYFSGVPLLTNVKCLLYFHFGVIQMQAIARDLYLLHSAQTVSGAHSASYPMGTAESFYAGKASCVQS